MAEARRYDQAQNDGDDLSENSVNTTISQIVQVNLIFKNKLNFMIPYEISLLFDCRNTIWLNILHAFCL